VYLGIAKAYFGVWSPQDLPAVQAPFDRASARRLLQRRGTSPATRSQRLLKKVPPVLIEALSQSAQLRSRYSPPASLAAEMVAREMRGLSIADASCKQCRDSSLANSPGTCEAIGLPAVASPVFPMPGGCESLRLSPANSSELFVAVLGQAPVGSWPLSFVLPTDHDRVDRPTFANNQQQISNSVGRLSKKLGDLLVCERALLLEQLKNGPLHATSEGGARRASREDAASASSASAEESNAAAVGSLTDRSSAETTSMLDAETQVKDGVSTAPFERPAAASGAQAYLSL
jgi:hypothetical protein